MATLMLVLTSLLLPMTVRAAAFVNLYNNFPGGGGTDVANNTTWLAQPFVPTVSGTARLLSVWIQCTSDGNNCYPGAATMSIYPDVNGQPGTTPLVTSEEFVPGRDAPVQGTCLILPSPPALTAGTPYWAVLKGTTTTYQNWYHAGTLTSVNTMRSTDSGATWALTRPDFRQPFSLRVDDGEFCVGHLVPLPEGGVEVGGMAPRSGHDDVQTITLGNDGIGNLTLLGYSITGANASVYRLMTENVKDSPTARVFPSEPYSIIPNGLKILYVTCTGPEEDGHYVADLTFRTDDPDNPTISWPLSCWVDNTPPELFVTPSPNGDSGWYKTLPANIFVSSWDGLHGSGTNYIDCDVNGLDFFITDSAGAANVPVTVPPAFEGLGPDSTENVMSCTGHDVAGNVTPSPFTNTFKIDSRPPVITPLVVPPANAAGWHNQDVDISFSCADPEPGSGMLSNDVGGGGHYVDETAGTPVANTGGCRDVAGGVGAQATVTLKIDKTVPTGTEIVSGPFQPRTGDTTATFELEGTDALSGVASFICQLDDAAPDPCESDMPSFPGLADGTHTLRVWAVDAADNVDPIGTSWTWYVDTSPPEVTFDGPADGATTRANGSITFHATDVDDDDFLFLCEFDGGPADECTSPFVYESLSGGPHELGVTALDGAGNASVQEVLTFTVDAVAPTVTMNQGARQDDPTSESPIRFLVIFSESVAGFGNSASDIVLSGSAGPTTVDVTPLFSLTPFTRFEVEVSGMSSDGTVIASVRAGAATDLAGNPNVASTSTDNSVTYDAPNTAPVAADDTATTAEDTQIVASAPGVLDNDTDADSDDLTAVLVAGPANGQVTLNGDGSWTYDPNPGYSGSDAFTYKANDGTVDSNVATVRITITTVNDVPSVSVAPGGSCGATTTVGTMNLVLADADHAAGALTLVASSSNRRVVPTGNIVLAGSGASRTVTITPIPQRRGGSATVTLTVGDGSATSTTTITVVISSGQGDIVDGTSGADMLFAFAGTNTMNGGAGNDLLCGGTGADTINGGDGSDTIDGRNGSDSLFGGAGDDILRGGAGNDTATGGAGADTFSGGAGTDAVTDFEAGQGDTLEGTLP